MMNPLMVWQQQEDPDPIANAVKDALMPIMTWEQEWAMHKLMTRIKGYFHNAAKGLNFGSSLEEVVKEYAHSVYNSIFQALHDRAWLKLVDFLPVMNIAVQNLFPVTLTLQVSAEMLEQMVMAANDSAFEESRFTQKLLWDVVVKYVHQVPVQKAVYNAFELGWKAAAAGTSREEQSENLSPLQNFVKRLVASCLQHLASNVRLDTSLPQHQATQLFMALVQAGCLPAALVIQAGKPPADWPFLVSEVQFAYTAAVQKGGKGKGKGKWGWNGGADAWTGGWAGGVSAWTVGSTDAKRQKLMAGSQSLASPKAAAAPIVKGPGHPLCTQVEDCIGNPDDNLQHHLSDSSDGDIYCSTCWTLFAAEDPTLQSTDLGNLK